MKNNIEIKEAWYASGQKGTLEKGLSFSMPLAGYVGTPPIDYWFSSDVNWCKVDKKELAYDEASANKIIEESTKEWIALYEKWAEENTKAAATLREKLVKK